MVKNVCQKEKNISHPLFGISFKKWLDLLIYNRGFEPEYFTRVFFITLTSISLIPLRFLFKIFYGPLIEKTMVKHPPIFIIGHWRSGTTFLHELISQDPQIGYVSLWQTLLPESFLILEKSKDFLSKFLPRTRPMDNIEVDINGPYEEEAGLAVLSKWSFFHCFHFPRFAKRQYFKSVHFKDLNENEIKQWKKTYTQLIKAATFTNHGKLLVLKNPSNTARIKILLEMFPDAKFIHIYRNPFYVYVSTIKMRTRVLEKLALQNTTNEEIKKHVIEDYIHLMKTFFKQKKLIPEGNLVEIRYEELVKNPLIQIRKIYDQLNIPGFNRAETTMKRYLQSKKNYKTNIYNFNKEILETVTKNWGFTLKKWGYKQPD